MSDEETSGFTMRQVKAKSVDNPKKVPFTLLTGFLGSGKTTILNRVLAAPNRRRIAVLVNELGRIDIDSRQILSRGGDVLELAGGCVCCKVDLKNDLWDGIGEIVARAKPDHVILETTGIAEPSAILAGFDRIPSAQRHLIAPAGVVCLFDCQAGPRHAAAREEARRQVESADRLLLSKLDVASAQQVAEAHRALDELNTSAERASFPRQPDVESALANWVLEPRNIRQVPRRTPPHRQGQVTAVCYVDESPLAGPPLVAMLRTMSKSLLRVKGFVHIANEHRRGFVEVAGDDISLRVGEPWGPTSPSNEIVFIGEDLNETAIRRQLWACRPGV